MRADACDRYAAIDPERVELGQPEIRERRAGLLVDVFPELQPPATTGNDDGQVVVLVGRPVAHTSTEGEDGVVEKRRTVGFLDFLHANTILKFHFLQQNGR